MLHTPDLYLGTFLVLCGFALSLLNLRRVLKKQNSYTTVLLSENILLSCIGIAFVARSIAEVTPTTMDLEDMERSTMIKNVPHDCDFKSMLMSYGPLIVSLVNSFLSLIIDNYMHYKMLEGVREKDEENEVQDISERRLARKIQVKKFYSFLQKYFSYIAVFLQWVLPASMLLAMYPMEVKEKLMPLRDFRTEQSCMALLNANNETCSNDNTYTNFTLELRKYITTPSNYLEVFENDFGNTNTTEKINNVVKNVYKIVANLKGKNNTFIDMNITSPYLRRSKSDENCMKMCYVENKKLLLYMFMLAIVSYFVPITISVVILSKIHVMRIQKPNLKTYVSRELLYNVLFWTPVMFDTFLSLILCSYSMNGMRTSLFNIVANVYQAVKNFMNTKYFKDNTVLPV